MTTVHDMVWRALAGLVLPLLVGVVLLLGTPVLAKPAVKPKPPTAPASLLAQPATAKPPKGPAPGEVETDPIKCWWRSDKSSVLVGERFTLTLTCGVIDTARIKIVPDTNQLEPTAVQLSPFEVVRGTRHEDLVAPPWRYFQYEYVVRLVGDSFFGKDIDLPALKVSYRVQSAIGGGTQGRDQAYVLPALPMRIASLVPKKANDIRDAMGDTFGDIEARRLRSTEAFVAAAILFGFAFVLLALAAARVVGRYRVRAPSVARPLPLPAVLRGCLRAVRAVKRDVTAGGWSPDLVARALSALRIAAAVALGRRVAQSIVSSNTPHREGQLVLRRGWRLSKRALISTPITADDLARSSETNDATSSRAQAVLDDLHESLRVFSVARYGRDSRLDTASLDLALDTAIHAIRRLRFAKLWPMRTAGAVAKSASELGGMVWSR